MPSDSREFSGHDLAVQAHYKLVEKLAESEHRFRELVELQQDIVFRCSTAGILEYVSPSVEDVLGVAAHSCVGIPLTDLLESGDAEAARQIQLILSGVPRGQEARFRFKGEGGRARWLEVQARQRLGGGSVGTLRDVTDVVIHERERGRLHAELVERNAQLKVQDRRREEQAAALRHRYDLQELLTRISARMLEIQSKGVDAAVVEALGEVGAFMGVDRSYVFLFHEGQELLSNTHEWCAEGVSPERENLQDLPFEAVPWWVSEIQAGRTIHAGSLDELPPEAASEREILEAQGIQSVVVVPLVARSRPVGFVGFDAVRSARSWDADVVALLALVGDILLGALERARVERLREESAARYRLLADNARDLIWRTDLDLRFEFVNPAAARLLGREAASLVGLGIEEVCDAETAERMRSSLEKAREQGEQADAAATLMHGIQHTDGSTLPVETIASFVLDPAGEPIAIQGTTRDISERVAAEAALRESRTRMDLVVEGIHEGILMVDLEERVQVANREVRLLLGHPGGEVLGTPLADLLSPLEGAGPLLSDLGSVQESVEVRTPGTPARILTITTSPYLDHHGWLAGRLLLVRDVTAEREVERMKSQFVASVSHELRTPLTSILGFARTLLRKPDLDEDSRTEFLGIIHSQSERLHHLIEDILEISKIESGGTGLSLESIDLPGITQGVVTGLRTKAEAGEVALSVALPEPPHAPLMGDPARVRSVVENLVDNAIKFTPAGRSVTVSLTQDAGTWRLEVQDTGLGIPADHLERIFERFHRVVRPGLEIAGTGLGLAIVKEIVEAHGGRISVSSVLDEGTRFEVELPCAGPVPGRADAR